MVPTASPPTLTVTIDIPTSGYNPMTRLIDSAGIPMVCTRSDRQISAAPGTPGAPTERIKMEKNRDIIMLPVTVIPNILAMKRVEIIRATHEPSMLMVAPRGSEKE